MRAQCSRCKKYFEISDQELKLGVSTHTCDDLFTTALSEAIKKFKTKKSKYNNIRTEYKGVSYASKSEASRAQALDRLKEAGQVKYWLRQVPFFLPGNIKYISDFMIVWNDGQITYEDVKGMQTQVFKNKKKQVEALYPVKIEVVK